MSLPRLDLSALTHHAAKWPLPGKVLLGCALAGLVLAVGNSVVLAPSRERLRVLQTQEVALQQALAQKTDLAANLERRSDEAQAMQARVGGLFRQLSAESDMPGLLEDIARLAAGDGLLVEGVKVLDEQPRPFYIEAPVQVGVLGTYHDLATFVSGLGGLARIVTVHDLALASDGALLRVELLAKTYRSLSPHGEPGPVTPWGPRFAYSAAALRDPFQPSAMQVEHAPGKPAPAPDLSRPRGVLESLAVDQFEMVGTLSRGIQRFALLRAASSVHRLAVGDYLGPNHGRVTAIHDGHIELAELFPDEQGAWLQRSRTLVLNVNS
ncbi:pilus assembly protein PilP [Pseudomonas trivialis]|uniref:Pilus assembly protein n=1 Tax=Pseudomonas trivialis TaxID=200450 RepID=A0A0R2ZFF9_9PSED|nr:pilus assembly protein PilP [Pseudomonas trivialis]KRP59727.1 pilus assembly protein [Pseudomonas trivialis]SDS19876.1 type IV pilus assembly protein PilO [Pseudomonas trivialis]